MAILEDRNEDEQKSTNSSHNSKVKTVENVLHSKHNVSDKSNYHQIQSDQVCGLEGRALQQMLPHFLALFLIGTYY